MAHHILIITDDETERLAVETALEQAHYLVSCAPSCAIAAVTLSEGAVDLVLLSSALEDTSGYDAARTLRAIPGCERLPFLLLANPSAEDLEAAIQAGVDDFISLPLRAPELLMRIGSILRVLDAHAARLQKFAETRAREHASKGLLDLIGRAHDAFISGREPRALFNDILDPLLDLTQSEYGFIGEVQHDEDGTPFLQILALTNIAWNDETQRLYEQYETVGLEFRNLNTLFGACIVTEAAVIANSPSTDHRAGGLPPHHPALEAFLGLPFFKGSEMAGMIGIANRPDGYSFEVAQYLEPFCSMCAGIIEAHRVERRRRESERSLLETELKLSRSQKLEAVGKLAGGIAHDFNNLLLAISTFTEFVYDSLPEGDERDDLREVMNAADKAAALTRQLLLFSRQQPAALGPVDLNEIVRGLSNLLERTLGEDIALEIVLADSPAIVRADSGQLDQLVVNLAVNARDAMPEGGALRIEVSADDSAGDGGLVILRVEDTGVGMSEETKQHIFEPFFTTKERTGGTGLGLSTCYGVVTQFGGTIEAESAPGEGSTFIITLPRIDETPTEAPQPTTGELVGNETLLVVEDEPAVRRVVQRTLEARGYHVIVTENAEDAMETFERLGHEIDMVFSDVVLPKGNGFDLAEWLHTKRPELPILLASGYTDNRGRQEQLQLPILWKPYKPDELARQIRACLEQRAGS